MWKLIEKKGDQKQYYRDYSLSEVREILDLPVPEGAASHERDSNWAGCSYDEAKKSAYVGMEDLYSKAKELSKSKQVSNSLLIDSVVPVNRYDYSGENVDLDRYLSGEPECCVSLQDREGTTKRVINLIVCCGASASYSSASLINRGIYIASIVEALTHAGYSVGVICVWCTANNGKLNIAVRVKHPGEFIDPCLLTYWLSHSSILRRIFFRLGEHEPREIRNLIGLGTQYGGYGQSTSIDKELIEDPESYIIINRISSDNTNQEEKNIYNSLISQGILKV